MPVEPLRLIRLSRTLESANIGYRYPVREAFLTPTMVVSVFFSIIPL